MSSIRALMERAGGQGCGRRGSPTSSLPALGGRRAAVLGAVALAGLAGCGGDDPGTGDAGEVSPDEPVEVRVGETAGVPYAFLQFGVDQGFYREAGVDVEAVPVQGAAPILSGVVSQEYEMGGSDTATFSQALAEDVPLTMITPGTSVSDRPEGDFSALMVSPRSDIRDAEDLRGTTIGVNILGNISEVSFSGALEELGVDPEAVEFTEIPFPEMVPAVEQGQVDGAFIIEPFRTIGASAGLRSVFGPFSSFEPGLQIGSIVTTEQYASENPEVISAFQEAHARTARYVAENEAEFRRALPEIAELEPDLADAVNLPVWEEQVDPEDVEIVAEAMERFGLVDEAPDVGEAINEGA